MPGNECMGPDERDEGVGTPTQTPIPPAGNVFHDDTKCNIRISGNRLPVSNINNYLLFMSESK